MSQEKLQLIDVSKRYGTVQAVESVSIGLKEGQMLALLGPSGCGKTTTLRMVAGLERPTGGEIRLDGRISPMPTTACHPNGADSAWFSRPTRSGRT